MIELPEAVVLARQVKETLCAKKILDVAANAAPHKFAWFTGDPANYPGLLTGKVIRDASACGNHVEIQAGELLLAISTPIKYHDQGQKPPKKHQLLITFEDQTSVSCTVQMWGAILCLGPGEEGGLIDYKQAKVTPSPFLEAFNAPYFQSLMVGEYEKLSAKAFLATEQRIPGLGNGVLQDILWSAHIHPRRKMGTLSGDETDAMYHAVKDMLIAMADQGGRDTERDLFDRTGGYRTVLSRNTAGKPCPVCGAVIQKEAYMGGSVYFCPVCQPLA